ncbi:MAG: hypothetical protein LBU36_07455 [Clostridiales bacterium]|jgi:hypothetical protein|nr:hypothetical protein [Clostridiales bacterium]
MKIELSDAFANNYAKAAAAFSARTSFPGGEKPPGADPKTAESGVVFERAEPAPPGAERIEADQRSVDNYTRTARKSVWDDWSGGRPATAADQAMLDESLKIARENSAFVNFLVFALGWHNQGRSIDCSEDGIAKMVEEYKKRQAEGTLNKESPFGILEEGEFDEYVKKHYEKVDAYKKLREAYNQYVSWLEPMDTDSLLLERLDQAL